MYIKIINHFMSIFTLFILFSTGFIAGLIDTIAGGGLITVPALLSIGLPPHLALGTNKLQSSFGSGSASLNFLLAKRVNLKECLFGIFTTFNRCEFRHYTGTIY